MPCAAFSSFPWPNWSFHPFQSVTFFSSESWRNTRTSQPFSSVIASVFFLLVRVTVLPRLFCSLSRISLTFSSVSTFPKLPVENQTYERRMGGPIITLRAKFFWFKGDDLCFLNHILQTITADRWRRTWRRNGRADNESRSRCSVAG